MLGFFIVALCRWIFCVIFWQFKKFIDYILYFFFHSPHTRWNVKIEFCLVNHMELVSSVVCSDFLTLLVNVNLIWLNWLAILFFFSYLVAFLHDTQKKWLYLVPHNKERQWILGVINPWKGLVLYFDPFREKKRDIFTNLINM